MASFELPFSGNYRISSNYGPRTAPTAGASSNHKGIDFAMPVGTPVLSSASGTISKIGNSAARGNYVIVDNGGGFSTLYQHLSSFSVGEGSTVLAGEEIAKSGNTGIGTGAHLHFEILKDGVNVNPNDYISALRGKEETMNGIQQVKAAAQSAGDYIKKYWYLVIGVLIALGLWDRFKD